MTESLGDDDDLMSLNNQQQQQQQQRNHQHPIDQREDNLERVNGGEERNIFDNNSFFCDIQV